MVMLHRIGNTRIDLGKKWGAEMKESLKLQ